MKITITKVVLAGAAVYAGLWYYNQRKAGVMAPTPASFVDAVKSDVTAVTRPLGIAPFPATIVKGPEISPDSATDDIATTRSYVSLAQPFYANAPYPTQLPTVRGPTPAGLTRTERIRAFGN